jgi:Ras GTPase-activating-like protein IQGAP2/3
LRRRGPGEEYLRNALRDIIVELAARTDSLEINPIKVYEEMVESGEVHAEHKSFSEKMAAAERHEGVRSRVTERIKTLEGITTSFLDVIVQSIDQVPYGIRWLCKAIRQLVMVSFTVTYKYFMIGINEYIYIMSVKYIR